MQLQRSLRLKKLLSNQETKEKRVWGNLKNFYARQNEMKGNERKGY